MAKATIRPDYDLEDVGGAIAARFDALPWDRFDDVDKKKRDALIGEIFVIRRDLMKLGEHDMRMAARIWDEHVPTFVPRPLDFDNPDPDPIFVNMIERGRRKRRPSPDPWLEEQTDDQTKAEANRPTIQVQTQPPTPEPETDPKARRHRLLLEGLEKQYLKAEDKYHFRDRAGQIAFEAREKRLVTTYETPAIVSSMVDLAETRGWETLKLSGTEEFRREAWLQASLRGLDVTGFRPNKLDKARLEEMRSEFGSNRGGPNSIARGQEPPREQANSGPVSIDETGRSEDRPELSEGQDAVLAALEKAMRARGDSDQAIAAASELAARKLGKGRIHFGKVAEQGVAPYQDKVGEVQSHYVVLEDEAGRRRKIWGADLPRAIDEGKIKTGDQIALAFRGQKTVTVMVKVPSEDGKGTRLEKRDVERNAWEAVKFDRLRESVRQKVEHQATGVARYAPSPNQPNDRSSPSPRQRERYR